MYFDENEVIGVWLLISIKFAWKKVGSFIIRSVRLDFWYDEVWKQFWGIDSKINGPSENL